jgi:pantoate--beta-alanine ligase
MLILKTAAECSAFIAAYRNNKPSHKIGFAPTMGALHEGHLSLLRSAQSDCALTIASIFVNPTQFNDPADLEKYPRPLEHDLKLLNRVGCDVLFLPEVADIYPNGTAWQNPFQFGALVTVMEGAHRPGHFDGMAQVVKRLLDIVQPDFLYMGQKDFQQQTIVKAMLAQMNSTCELVRCPILRESDGLAMSSRNIRLSPNERTLAPRIHAAMCLAQAQKTTYSPIKTRQNVIDFLNETPDFSIDYVEIVDSTTLLPIKNWSDSAEAVICATVRLGGVRLLDNSILQ